MHIIKTPADAREALRRVTGRQLDGLRIVGVGASISEQLQDIAAHVLGIVPNTREA